MKGKKIGKYQLEDKVGEGSYGEVWSATNQSSNEKVAVKIVRKNQSDRTLVAQINSEISILKQVDHPSIVKLHDLYETPNNYYMVMEYCSGGDLEELVMKRGPPPEATAQKWIRQLLNAFTCLQQHRVMHRDIKLANIILTDPSPQADAKLADFGFARLMGESLMAATMLGTPVFMSPELLRNENYTFKADVWSLGIVCYEMLVGKPAYEVKSMRELIERQRNKLKYPPTCPLSETAKDFLTTMLVYEPRNRPSFEDMKNHPFMLHEMHPQGTHPSLGGSQPVIYPQLESPPVNKERVSRTVHMQLDFKVQQLDDLLQYHRKVQGNNEFATIALTYYSLTGYEQCYREAEEARKKLGRNEYLSEAMSELHEKLQLAIMTCNDNIQALARGYDFYVQGSVNTSFIEMSGEFLLSEYKELLSAPPENHQELKNRYELLIVVKKLLPTNLEATELLEAASASLFTQ